MTGKRMLPDNRFVECLRNSRDTLLWLKNNQPVDLADVPAYHWHNIEKLEEIGVVFLRNNQSVELRHQRLRKIIESLCEPARGQSWTSGRVSALATQIGLV